MKFSDTFTKEGWRVILEGAYTLIGGGGTPGKRRLVRVQGKPTKAASFSDI